MQAQLKGGKSLVHFRSIDRPKFDSVPLSQEQQHEPFAAREFTMIGQKLISAASLFVAAGSLTSGASAITVELAKKCEALTTQAFPPRVIGNPAAGSTKGSGRDLQAYFNKCVKNGGKVDDAGSKETK
jgi:hypothetical protein